MSLLSNSVTGALHSDAVGINPAANDGYRQSQHAREPDTPSGIARRFQVLSLDGGGLKGTFSAALLAGLEEDLGIRITDHFDLITGTSTGGIIALALGAGLRPAEIVDFYTESGPIIFHNHLRWRSLRWPFLSKYDASPLRLALDEIFGDRTMASSASRLVIPTFNLDDNDVYVVKTPHHPRLRRDGRALMTDVAVATSAAPTFFPVATIGGVRLVDGGVWANNPAMVGVTEAVAVAGAPLDEVRLFSVGTTVEVRQRSRMLDRGGIGPWLISGRSVALDGQAVAAHSQATLLLGKERYLRANPPVPQGRFKLDRADLTRLMAKAATESRQLSPAYDELFNNHTAASYQPMTTKETNHA